MNLSTTVLRCLLGASCSVSFLAATTPAQSYVFGRASFGTGVEPSALATGDFNADGKLDLVVTNRSDNTLSVLLGKPDGTFGPKVDYPTGVNPGSVVVADFDGDGNLDVAITNENCIPLSLPRGPICGAGTISILFGNGDGTFQPHTDYATGTRPLSVVVSDFNGDGKLDLAVANNVDSTVSIFLGNGDGTFRTRVDYATTANPTSLIAADFNGDSKLDLAVGSEGSLSVLLGIGDGTFQPHAEFPGGASLVAADFNGDGRVDIAAAGDVLYILLGNGSGSFAVAASYPSSINATLLSADFNGDGKPDIAYLEGDAVSMLLGNGDGTFQPRATYGAGLQSSGVVTGDFNGDGLLDLAFSDKCPFACSSSSGSYGPGAVTVLLGLPGGTFVGNASYGTDRGPSFVSSSDFNGDNKLDLVTANQGGDSVSILLGNGDGTFQTQSTNAAGHFPNWVLSGDFNGDGKKDLAVVNAICTYSPCGLGSVSILLGNGDGTFGSHVEYPVGVAPSSLAIADFNGDGKLDLAVTNPGAGLVIGNTVSVLLGNGNGTFQPHTDYITPLSPGAIVTADFNRDGKLDLAITDGQNALAVLPGNGDGTFRAAVDEQFGYSAGSSIATGDFNGDGIPDLVVGTNEPGVSILLGKGDGTFLPPVSFALMFNSNIYVGVGDFNGDGKLDVAAAQTGALFILAGHGDGTFSQPIFLLEPCCYLSSIVVNDFNADGTSDVAASIGDQNIVSVTLNAPFKAVYPTALSFGSQGVGTTSAVQTVTLTNPSSVSFAVAGIVLSAGDFHATNNCGASLSPGASCSINLSFSPSALGPRSSTITLTDGTRSSPQVIPLNGVGVSGPFLVFSQPKLDFALQPVGSEGLPRNVVLTNTGNAPLTISGIAITGADSSDFKQTNTCGSSLAPGGYCTVTSTFAPAAPGNRTASLTITDNALHSPQSFSLLGSASDFSLTAATGSNCPVNENCSTSATISAGGTASYALQVTPINGFNSSVALSCTSAPSPAACSISPASVPPRGSSSYAFVVTVSNTSTVMALPSRTPSSRSPSFRIRLWISAIFYLAIIGMLPCFARTSRTSKLGVGLAFFLVLFSLANLSSCGGGSGSTSGQPPSNATKPPSNVTFSVAGTSAGVSRSLSLSLTVNH